MEDLLKRFTVPIAATITFITSVYNFVKLWQGDRQLLTQVALFATLLILIGCCLYVLFKKVVKKQNDFVKGTISEKKSLYPLWARIAACSILIFIPIITICFYTVKFYIDGLPPEKIIILVAKFQNAEEDSYAVTESLIQTLQERTSQYPEIEIKSVDKVVTIQEGSKVARELGKQHKAAIVLWGWYRKSQVNGFLELLMEKPQYLNVRSNKETLNATALKALDGVEIQTDISKDMSFFILTTIGLLKFEANQYGTAIEMFSNAANLQAAPEQMIDPTDLFYYRGLAHSYLEHYPSALADFNEVLNRRIDYPGIYLNRAFVNSKLKRVDDAIADGEKDLAQTPGNYLSNFNMASYCLDKGLFTKAIEHYDKSIALESNYINAYYARGLTLQRVFSYELANKDFDKVIELSKAAISGQPEDWNYYAQIASVAALKKDYESSINYLNKAIEEFPGQKATLCNHRGNVFYNSARFDLALEDYNEAIRLDENNPEYYHNRANVFIETNQLDLALADSNKALTLQSNTFQPYLIRAVTYTSKGQYDPAIEDLTKAITLDPYNGPLYYERGRNYFFQEKLDLAKADAEKSVSLDPMDADSYRLLFYIYQTLEDSKQAELYLDKALDIYSQKIKVQPAPEVYFGIATIYEERGEIAKALENFNNAIRLKPNSPEYVYRRGLLYYGQKEFDNSLEDFKSAVRLNPLDPQYHSSLGSLYFERELYDEAIASFTEAIKYDPKNAENFNSRGYTYVRKNELEPALADINKAIEMDPDQAHFYDSRGLAYKLLNEKSKAIADYRQVLKLTSDPDIVKEARKQLRSLGAK